MKKQYFSRNGQIEYEIDEAGEILTYGRDALGNVVAGYDKNTNAVFTLDYKPFGEFAATTGTITGRRFLWVGTWGYRFTPGIPVSHYIRARHLMMRMGMWVTVDPLWPEEMAFGYVVGSPIRLRDATGLQADAFQDYFDRLFPPGPGIPASIIPEPFNPCPAHKTPKQWTFSFFQDDVLFFNDVLWGYGNCCGPSRKCGPSSKTYNCTDAACKEHDTCVGSSVHVGAVNWLPCNKKFCNDIKYCWNQHCKKRPIDITQCKAIIDIAIAFCTSFGGGPPQLGKPWN